MTGTGATPQDIPCTESQEHFTWRSREGTSFDPRTNIVKTQYPLHIEVTSSFHASLDCCAAPERGPHLEATSLNNPSHLWGKAGPRGTFIQCKRPCEVDTVSILCLRTLQPRKFGSSMEDKAQNWLPEEPQSAAQQAVLPLRRRERASGQRRSKVCPIQGESILSFLEPVTVRVVQAQSLVQNAG